MIQHTTEPPSINISPVISIYPDSNYSKESNLTKFSIYSRMLIRQASSEEERYLDMSLR